MANLNTNLRSVLNEDGAAILDTLRGTIWTLNVVGAYIWQALERGDSEEVIVADLARQTGISQDVIVRDVRNFLASLEEHNLLAH